VASNKSPLSRWHRYLAVTVHRPPWNWELGTGY
jgi:hypothetical protein